MRARALAPGLAILLAGGATAWAGPFQGLDTDGDGVENQFDNCTLVGNPDQADANHDGCGNVCTRPISCDLAGNMDFIVAGPDIAVIGTNFGMSVPPGTNGDCTGDGLVGGADLATAGREWLNRVGPSGINSGLCDPTTCSCIPQ
jgi:hypothetical protein